MNTTINVADITVDPRCQPRQRIDEVTVAEYVQAMRDGATFPPVTVYQDGETSWLADGFHRIAAAKEAGLATVPADIRPGDIRAAMLHAVGANATHGLRRSNADKRRAVETLLGDDEWASWSDHEIARRCAVSQPFVSDRRNSLITLISDTPTERTYTDRYGNVRTMDVSRIGVRQCGVTHPFVAKMRRERSGNGYQGAQEVAERKWLKRLGVPDPMPVWSEYRFLYLKRDIAANGVIVPVRIDQYGDVIDGVHRIRAWTELRSEGADIPEYPRIIAKYDSDEARMDDFVACNMIGRTDPGIEIDSRWVAAFGYRYPNVIRLYNIAPPGQPPRNPGMDELDEIERAEFERVLDVKFGTINQKAVPAILMVGEWGYEFDTVMDALDITDPQHQEQIHQAVAAYNA